MNLINLKRFSDDCKKVQLLGFCVSKNILLIKNLAVTRTKSESVIFKPCLFQSQVSISTENELSCELFGYGKHQNDHSELSDEGQNVRSLNGKENISNGGTLFE